MTLAVLTAGCTGDGVLSALTNDPPVGPAPVPPSEFVGSDGLCDDPAGGAAAPAKFGFDMTECEVVRLAGPLDRIEIGTNDKGERTATLTSIAGARPGVYRFVAGRLKVIEGPPELAPSSRQTRPPPRR